MPTTILFNDDAKNARNRLQVDEEPDKVAAALEGGGIAQLTAKGGPVWVNSRSVRILKRAPGARAAPAGGAAGAGGAARKRRRGQG